MFNLRLCRGWKRAREATAPAASAAGEMHADLVCLMKANCLRGDDKHPGVLCCGFHVILGLPLTVMKASASLVITQRFSLLFFMAFKDTSLLL